ncbi:Protein CBR-TTR-25 [Caenorhabditis briggsae]|nr:Protein CBR-TTR-25 [Caenorhabditis briggsae]ULT92566.1 hypothetical protein L3Y34_009975 [Caenorhabditis briggsae]UMM38316.1 hypothetical protein L5515_009778 [Caenorhabditis briggsae]CAP31800.2 Protein CBR-TTR-25 [Caenorhabditis briggsae]
MLVSLKSFLLLLALIGFAHALGGVVGRGQKVTVMGKLVCNGAAAADVKVKMYEDGTIYDTKMDTMNTLADGTFNLMGSQKKVRSIDPKLNIYHRCNHHGLCPKKVTIHVPKNAVGKGSKDAQLFDIGVLNLANKFPGETTDCIH